MFAYLSVSVSDLMTECRGSLINGWDSNPPLFFLLINDLLLWAESSPFRCVPTYGHLLHRFCVCVYLWSEWIWNQQFSVCKWWAEAHRAHATRFLVDPHAHIPFKVLVYLFFRDTATVCKVWKPGVSLCLVFVFINIDEIKHFCLWYVFSQSFTIFLLGSLFLIYFNILFMI